MFTNLLITDIRHEHFPQNSLQYMQQQQTIAKGSTSLQEKGSTLFKSILSSEDITELSTINDKKEFLKLCSIVGTLFYRKVSKKPNQVLAFLTNYHQIIMNLNIGIASSTQSNLKNNAAFINNVSLHFILLASYNALDSGKELQAKQLLKNSINYIDSTDPDPILLTTALSNLSLIMMKRGKYYKPLPYMIRVVQILECYIKSIKKSQMSEQEKQYEIVEVSIFLVNGYLNLSKCLQKIICKNNKDVYKNLLQDVNKTGLKRSLRYLGKTSHFTNKFMNQIQYQTSKNIYHLKLPLPVCKIYPQVQPQSEQQSEEERDRKIMVEFQKLYVLIRQIQQKQTVQIQKPIQAPPPPPPPPPITVLSSQQLILKLSFQINGWDVEVEVLKDKKKQKVGTTVLNCFRNKQQVSAMIQQKKMLGIITQMNLYDVIPYETYFWAMTVEEFIEYCVIDFLSIDDNKNLQLYPRTLGFTNPLSINFLQKNCLVFINHIRFNNYRAAICPMEKCTTFHLDIQFQPQFIEELIEFSDQVDGSMGKLYEELLKYVPNRRDSGTTRLKSYLESQGKHFNLKNQDKFRLIILNILKKFQSFVFEKKIQEDIEIFEEEQEYYKFKQCPKISSEGRFYYIKYIENMDSIEVFTQNTFETYGMEGKYKSKGNASLSLTQISSDFGFIESNLRLLLKETPYRPFKMVAQILSKKFDLKCYDCPLSETNKETFQENSIIELKLSFKTFLRKMVRYKDYMHPLTITLIIMNNQFPVGLKISLYDQIICEEAGYFIHIFPDVWKWPIEVIPRKNQYEDILYNVVEQYKYKKDYFLVDWLERIGYRKIFNMINITQEGDLEIPKLNLMFDRISSVISHIYP